jgi:hypothetical protein
MYNNNNIVSFQDDSLYYLILLYGLFFNYFSEQRKNFVVGVIIQKAAGGTLCFHELKWFTGGLRLSSGHRDKRVTLSITSLGFLDVLSLKVSQELTAFPRFATLEQIIHCDIL